MNASYPSDADGRFDPVHPSAWAYVVSAASAASFHVYTVCVPVA